MTYGEQCIKGVRHVSQTGVSPHAVRRICVGVAVLSTNTKYFLSKKIVYRAKINDEQRTVYSNTFVSFLPTIFYSAKKVILSPIHHVREQCLAGYRVKLGTHLACFVFHIRHCFRRLFAKNKTKHELMPIHFTYVMLFSYFCVA